MSSQPRKRGKFASNKQCAFAHKHEEWQIDSETNIQRMRDLPTTSVDDICDFADFTLTNKAKTERNLCFCEGCLTYIQSQQRSKQYQSQFEKYVMAESDICDKPSCSTATEPPYKNQSCQTDNSIIDLSDASLDLSKLKEDQRNYLAYNLAKSEKQNLEKDISEQSHKYKDITFLRNFDITQYLESQNILLKSFITGLQYETTVDNSYRLARAVEELSDICVYNTIQPIHFMESLILYCVTHSKTGLQLLCKQTPYPSYYTVQRWLRQLENTARIQHPLTSTIYAIDNNQILKKKWSIKVGNKCYSSVITMVVGFDLQQMDVLRNEENKPSKWRKFDKLTPDDIEKLKHLDNDDKYKEIHYKTTLIPYISQRLAKVLEEQRYVDGQWVDHIDEKVQSDKRETTFKICGQCDYDNSKTSRKCKGCGISLAQKTQEPQLPQSDAPKTVSERRVTVTDEAKGIKVQTEKLEHTRAEYLHIESDPEAKCPKVFVLQPSLYNPNSYEAIQNILLDVGRQAQIKKYSPESENQLAVIFCDGVPYNLIWRICECTYRCLDCQRLFRSRTEIDKHQHENMAKEFDWVIVIPGPGHLEMNMLKSFVLFLWPICWKEIVMLFNFNTETALRSARAVSDHHKGWTILNISRNAIVDELLVPFVRRELDALNQKNEGATDITIAPKDFFKYLDSDCIKNQNYLFMVDVAFEIIDAIFLYRTGIRSGNTEMAWAARAKFAKVWVGRNHPSYRELNTNDFMQRMMMPLDLGQFVDKAMSLNMSGEKFTGEGPDFRLEEVNKGVQSFLPLSPKNEDWQRVCANYDTLQNLRHRVMDLKGMDTPGDIFQPKTKQTTVQEEQEVRAMFRKNNYLNEPEQDCTLQSVAGTPLNGELVNFCTLFQENHAQFVEDAVLHNKTVWHEKIAAVKTKIQQISITEEELQESAILEKQTIANLTIMNETLLTGIQEVNAREGWNDLWKEIKGRSPKIDYVIFYKELTSFLQEITLMESSDESFEDD